MLDKDEKFVDGFAVRGERQNDVFRGDVFGVRTDIGRLASQRFAATGHIHTRIENSAGSGHVRNFVELGSRPVLGQMINDVCSDQAKPEIPRFPGNIEQNDLG